MTSPFGNLTWECCVVKNVAETWRRPQRKSLRGALSISRSVIRHDSGGRVDQPTTKGETTMRVMVIVKATKNSEAGVLPDEKLLTAMGKYNEELAKAGVMLAGARLHPRPQGQRIVFSCGP